MTTTVDAIAALQKEFNELLHPNDFPGDWSIRQVDAYEQRRHTLSVVIQTARAAASTLADVVPRLATETQCQSHLVAWRQALSDELAALAPSTKHDLGVQQNLSLSIQAIDRGEGVVKGTGYGLETLRLGTLMREAGYKPAPTIEGHAFGRLPWAGSLPEVTDRIAALTKQRNEAQAQLDEALLDEPARARLTAQRVERAARLNAMTKDERAAAIAAERATVTM
jgi:hypothetical protein